MAIKINQNNISFGSYTLSETPTGLLFTGNIQAFFPPAVSSAPTPAPTPTYSVSGAAGNVNEGSSLTFNVTTTNVANGTTLYWTVTNAGDFSVSSGSFTITSNAGSFSVTPTADSTTEGAETFTASVRTDSVSGTIVATSQTITINDTSTGPTYSVSAAAGNVNEGSSLTFNVTTTNVANGTTLYWTVSRPEDFSVSSGSFTITSNAGSFSVTPTADSTTEGSETFTASVRTVSTSGTIVATSGSVTINDTSTGPTYSVSPVANNVNEGSSLTFNVTTTLVSDGTTLYWTVSRPEDFSVSSGSFTITSNAGSFSVTPTADSTTEGAETFTASVRTVSTSGTIVATSSSVTINDTSVGATPPSATLLTNNFTVPSTTIGPINIYFRRLLFKTIYTAAELNTAGWSGSVTIYRISFYVTSVPFYQPIPGWVIGMQNTSSTVGSDLTTGWTTVRNSANAPTFVVNTENIITLDTPFTWNGTSNLAIGFASSQISPTYHPSGVVRGNTPGNSRSARTDSAGSYVLTDAAPTSTTYRPVITLYSTL